MDTIDPGCSKSSYQVRRQAQASQLPDAVLRGFGLLLPCSAGLHANTRRLTRTFPAQSARVWTWRAHLWDQADVDVAEVLSFNFELELSEGLDEGHALDVSHRAPQLQDTTWSAHPRLG